MNLKQFVMPEVVFMHNTTWKKTPGFINTYISKEGNVCLLNSKSELVKPTTQEWSTTKGTYKYVRVINDDFTGVMKAIHQLVCLTYHGPSPSDGRIYEPNHKNGDKHDNRPENLEWCTRKENVQHAFDSGICQAGLRIEAINKITGEVRKYNSLNRMSREWNIPRSKLRSIVANHRDTLYQNEWTFTIDNTSDKKVNRYQRKPIIFKNYLTGEIVITNDVEEASSYTKVKAPTIHHRLNSKNGYNTLLSNFVFKRVEDNIIWPIFSIEDALQAKAQYEK